MNYSRPVSALFLGCVFSTLGSFVPSANRDAHELATTTAISPVGILLDSRISQRELMTPSTMGFRCVRGTAQ